MPTPRFSLIVPAHNESTRIAAAIVDYLDAFADSEVLLVLNGCIDDTEEVVRLCAGDRPNLRILRIEDAVGKGGAVRAGFLASRASIVGYVDADGATSGAEIRRLFELIAPGVDGIIASRWKRGARVQVAQPLLRRIASRGFNALVRVLFGLPYSDTQCGAKIFTREAVTEIAATLETSNFAFDIDILYALRRAGRNVVEVPSVWSDVGGSTINSIAKASSVMLQAVLRLRLRHSLFRYVIPVFDIVWPTNPLRVRDGLAILILNRRDPGHPEAGPVENYLHEVASRLIARNHRVHWLSARFANAPDSEVIDGIAITRVGNHLSARAAIPLAYLRKFRDRYDVIIDVADGMPLLSPLFSLKPKLCLAFRIGNRRIEETVLKRIYGNSRFVAVSGEVKKTMQGLGIDGAMIDVVPRGIDFAKLPEPKATRPTILYVGNLEASQHVDELVAAMPALLSSLPSTELVVAGSGSEEASLRALVRHAGLEASIRFEATPQAAQRRKLLSAAWVVAAPVYSEDAALTVIEANACGTSFAGPAEAASAHAIIDGVNGLTFHDALGLEVVLERILADEGLRLDLEARALIRTRNFSWDATAAALLDIIFHQSARSHVRYVRSGDDDWSVLRPAGLESKMMRRDFEIHSFQ